MLATISLMLVAMLSIQLGAGLAKNLFPLAGAAGTTALRLFFATVILWLLWRPWRIRWERSILRQLCFYGAALGLMNLTFYFSLERIPLGLAVTLEFIGPLGIAIGSSRKRIDWLWACLAMLGVYLVMPQSKAEYSLDPLGVLFALVAGGFWAAYIYFGQRAGKNLHGGLATTMGMTFAALVAAPVGLFMDTTKVLSWSVIPLGILVALLSSAIPYSLEMVALKRLPAQTFGILMSLEPAMASIVGLLYLREQLNSSQWLAILFVIAASLGTVVTNPKRQEGIANPAI